MFLYFGNPSIYTDKKNYLTSQVSKIHFNPRVILSPSCADQALLDQVTIFSKRKSNTEYSPEKKPQTTPKNETNG